MYSFANLRDIVKDNDSNINEGNVKKGMVEFDRPSLILTQGVDDKDRMFKNCYVKRRNTLFCFKFAFQTYNYQMLLF